MPITISVVDHPAQPWNPRVKGASAAAILEGSSRHDHERCKRIIQSSFSTEGKLEEHHVSAERHGLVWAAYHAYSTHHHLTIRPEDIWFAIISQISFYINANAEDLRDYFVSHDGQEELIVRLDGNIDSQIYDMFTKLMADNISRNVKDPELRDWILPSFSTTTDTDRVVGSVLFMGAMQKYFSYTYILGCGIPSVTLLGELSDYEDILKRLDRLDEMGAEACVFAEMLRPILRRMILSFTEPTNPELKAFWNSIIDVRHMSGSTAVTGWITAFCYWSEKGVAQMLADSQQERDDGERDWETTIYMETDDIPAGFVSVPVKVIYLSRKYACTMLAGSIGIQGIPNYDNNVDMGKEKALSSKGEEFPEPVFTGIRPLTGWMIYEDKLLWKEAWKAIFNWGLLWSWL
uniref:WGS project CBMG000000000 data, contig CS5907-c000738 n=1 Tax=Fusarium acuminatum CS5907 TaxID=1318461 RepID=A0A096PEI4_9HYPO|nr:unnamed protein product [Fusarium acuminatum CS5907]